VEKIACGGAHARLEVDNDRIVEARMCGLLTPANAGALSALVLAAAVEQGAGGVLSSVERALVALPTIDPAHYGYVSPEQRHVPVAVVVSPEQYGVYARVIQAAAVAGTIRRAFLSREAAQRWLREQSRAMRANRGWWSGRRPSGP
jgi:hypothetical protein